MTNAEAISLLRGLEKSLDGYCELNEDGKKAFNKAISALEAQEQLANNSPELDKENGELIRKKAAIEALKEAFNPSITNFVKAKMAIDNLPSAQSEKRTEERTETHACDLIDRQAAQTELMMKCERYTLAKESHGIGHVEWSSDLISVADAMNAIRWLPSATPERKKGKWIDETDGGFVECPFCHTETRFIENIEDLHFCFWCGADMRGEQDE